MTTAKSAEERRLERKLLALQIDMAGECTNGAFLAMCQSYDAMHDQWTVALNHQITAQTRN